MVVQLGSRQAREQLRDLRGDVELLAGAHDLAQAVREGTPVFDRRHRGEGDLLDALRRQVQALGLQHRVTFAGYVLPADLARITRRAHVGIMLLANAGKSYYYSLANKFFDYIHAGVPQLLPDFPEYRDLNEQYGVGLYCAPDPDEIARALNRLAQDPDLHARLAGNCRQASPRLCWQQEEKILKAFYERIWN